jgi:hypothetical protein
LTNFHEDPEIGTYGWMYLAEGNKVWWYIYGDDIEHLNNNGIDIYAMKDLSFTNLVFLLDGYLWGKIKVTLHNNK